MGEVKGNREKGHLIFQRTLKAILEHARVNLGHPYTTKFYAVTFSLPSSPLPFLVPLSLSLSQFVYSS